jgi:hypothetical protein
MIIYTSTPYQAEESFREILSQAAMEIGKLGHQPFAPYGSDGALLPWPFRLEGLMRQCQGIYLLQGWQQSAEACIERHVCLRTGKAIFFQSAEERKSARDQQKQIISGRIQEAIHEASGMTIEQYRIHSRKEEFLFARMIYAHQGKRLGLHPDDTAKDLNISRSMIYHYLQKYGDEVMYNSEFRGMAEMVDKILTE